MTQSFVAQKRAVAWMLLLLVAFAAGVVGCDRRSGSVGASVSGERLLPGTIAPDFPAKTLTGETRNLSDFRGKLVLVNFWATWCGPCVREMPSIERLYQRFKGRNFEVVAVSVDIGESAKGLSKFVEQYGLSFTVLHDKEFYGAERFRVSGFPESFFIGPEGRLLAFDDPVLGGEGEKRVRIIGDRSWDADVYLSAIDRMLTSVGL